MHHVCILLMAGQLLLHLNQLKPLALVLLQQALV
jgi:hypothetical protein